MATETKDEEKKDDENNNLKPKKTLDTATWNLLEFEDFKYETAKMERLQEYANYAYSNETTCQYVATQKLRKLLSIENNPPIQQVIDTGIVPRFIEFLESAESDKLRFESAWCLTNIASGASTHTAVVINAGAVPIFIRLLRSHNPEIQEQAVWGLGNILSDSTEVRDHCLEQGAVDEIIILLNSLISANKLSSKIKPKDQYLALFRSTVWTLSNCCRGKPQPPFTYISKIIDMLSLIMSLEYQDSEILMDSCWASSYITDMDPGRENKTLHAMLKSGLLDQLIKKMDRKYNDSVRHPALRAIGNLVQYSDDTDTQILIERHALAQFFGLLSSRSLAIRREALWTLSGFTAGNKQQIAEVVNCGLVDVIFDMFNSQSFNVQKEALWTICNALQGGSNKHIEYIVNLGAMDYLLKYLDRQHHAVLKICFVCLEGIDSIFDCGDSLLTNEQEREALMVDLYFDEINKKSYIYDNESYYFRGDDGDGDGSLFVPKGICNICKEYVVQKVNKYVLTFFKYGGYNKLCQLLEDQMFSSEFHERCAQIITKYFGSENVDGWENLDQIVQFSWLPPLHVIQQKIYQNNDYISSSNRLQMMQSLCDTGNGLRKRMR